MAVPLNINFRFTPSGLSPHHVSVYTGFRVPGVNSILWRGNSKAFLEWFYFSLCYLQYFYLFIKFNFHSLNYLPVYVFLAFVPGFIHVLFETLNIFVVVLLNLIF